MRVQTKQIIFITVLLLMFTSIGHAATRRFRLGKIVCAQISKRMVSVLNLDTLALPSNYSSKIYAIVVVKLDKGRSLSIYDYSLKQGIDTFPCIAIRAGNGIFDASKWKFKSTSPDTLYSMLFILNIPGYSSTAKLDYTLFYNLSNSGMVKTLLNFQNLYYSSFTAVNSIPQTGLLQGKQ